MSIEIVADSTISDSEHLPNQHNYEKISLPPLISNSPPPFNEVNESGSINNLNTVFGFSESISSSNLSHKNSSPIINDTFYESNIYDKNKITVETEITKNEILSETKFLNSFDDEWSLFNVKKVGELNIQIDKIKLYDYETISINNKEINFNKHHETFIEDASNWAYFNEYLPELNTDDQTKSKNLFLDNYNSTNLEIKPDSSK